MNELQKAEMDILNYFDKFARKHELKYFLYSGTLLGAVRHKGFIPWDDDIDVALKRSEFTRFEQLFLSSDYLHDGFEYQTRVKSKYYALPFSKIRSNTLNVTEKTPASQPIYSGPWLDVFPFDNVPDDEVLRLKQFKKIYLCNKIIRKSLLIQVEDKDRGVKRLLKKIVQYFNERLYKFYFFLPFVFQLRDKYMQMYNDQETTHSGDLSYIFYKNYEEYKKQFFENKSLNDLVELEFEEKKYMAPRDYHNILTIQFGDYMTLPKEEDRKLHKIEYY